MDNNLLYKLIVIVLLIICIILLSVSCYKELFFDSDKSGKKILIISEKNNSNKNNSNKNNTKYDYIVRFNDNVSENDNTNVWFIDINTIKDMEKLDYIKGILTRNFDSYSKIIIEQNEEYNKEDIIGKFPRYKRMLKYYPNILEDYGVVFLPFEYSKIKSNEEKIKKYMLEEEPNCIIQII